MKSSVEILLLHYKEVHQMAVKANKITPEPEGVIDMFIKII